MLKHYLTLFIVLAFGVYDHLLAQGGADCAAALANQVSHNATYTNQNLCNKQNDFDGDGIPAFNFDFNGADWVYAITATQSGYQRITISNFSAPNGIRPFLGVFQGCPSNANLIQFRAPNMPYWTPATGAPLQIIIPVYQGQLYTIVVDGHFPPPPAGDFYSNCFSFTLQMQLTPFAVQNGCSNIGFEDGTLNGWMATTGTSMESFPGFSTPHYSVANIGEMVDRHTIMTGGTDPFGGFPCVAPGMGSKSLRLGNQFTGAQAEGISRTFQVTAANSSFTYWYAVVFQDPNHQPWEQPFFRAMLRTPDGQVINCTEFVVSAAANLPGFFNSPVNSNVRYKPWSSVNIDLSNYIGQVVTIEFTAGDCSHGAHFGYAYIDCFCATSPFIQSDNTICPGENITLSIPNGYTQYLWNPGNHQTQSITVSPSVTTIYTAQVTSENGCVTEFQDTVFVSPAPVASFTATPGGCGSPVQLNSTSQISSGSITQTQWIAGSSVMNGNPISYQFPTSGTFPVSLMVTSNQGCISSITQNVTVPSCALQANMTNMSVCENECATLQVNITDGLAPFTYNWVGLNANGGNTMTVCPATTTNYNVIITDATGASLSLTATVTVNPKPSINLNTQSVSCYNANNGNATVSATGGSSFIYLWSTGATSPQVNNLSPGNHQVTVTNNFGCQSNQNFTISGPSALNVTGQIIPETCGNANGSIQLTASGGTAPYQYRIGNGAFVTNPNFSALNAGNYTLEVMDANACSVSITLSVSSIPHLNSLNIITVNPNCSNQNGAIQINNSGFPFLVDVRLNNNLIANADQLPYIVNSLSAGNYQIDVTDENGCSTQANIALTAPTPIANADIITTPATCGQQNACINIQQVIGGTAPYQYALNGGVGQANPQFCNLSNGNMQVQITDANQCTLSLPVQINAADGIQATVDITQAITCFGANDGAAQVNITSGQGPFTFAWSSGANTPAVNGIVPGTHQVTVTDGNGCSTSFSVTLIEPAAITFDVTTTPSTCGNNNAQLQISNVNGANGTVNFTLNGNAAQAQNNGLNAGTYQVTVSDENQCSGQQSVNITALPFLSQINTSLTHPNCAQNTGSISINSANYSLSNTTISLNGQVQAAFSAFPYVLDNLGAGNYVLDITDENGCLVSETIELILPTGPSNANVLTTPATCGQQNACINIQQVIGGTAPYQYALNGGVGQANPQFCNLANGNVQLQITDANQCTLSLPVPINAADGIQATVDITQAITCFGANDGAAQVNITSGQGPFTFAWSSGANTPAVNGLVPGTHQVTVTDGNGCSTSFSVTLIEPAAITFDVTTTPSTCGNNNAQLQISNVNGANGNINFDLNGNAAQAQNNGLTAGTYQVTVSDENQCSGQQSVNITALPFLSQISTSLTHPNCAQNTGSISINSANYSLSNTTISLNGQIQAAFSAFPYVLDNLGAGNYVLDITDENGCLVSETIELILPTGPSNANVLITPATCGQQNACINIQQVIGGTAPYQYALNGGAGQANPQFCNLANGNVQLQITDANQCTLSLPVPINAADGIQATVDITQAITCFGANDGAAQVNITSGQGPFTFAWSSGSNTAAVNGLVPGTHQVTVTDGNGCSTSFSVTLIEPAAITFDVTTTPSTCGNNNAQLQISNVNGANGNINFDLNGNAAQAQNNGLAAGTYQVTVSDENQCSGQQSVNITALPFLSQISTSHTHPNCGQNTGSISINSVNYSLSNTTISLNGQVQVAFSAFPYVLDNLGAGNYVLDITDENGCLVSETIELILPTGPSNANVLTTPATCGQQNACINIQQVIGGTAPYQYALNGGAGQANPQFCNLANGNVQVQITDANQCILSLPVPINAADGIQATVDITQAITCFGANYGAAQVNITSGQGPFTFEWSSGSNTAAVNGLVPGTHQVTVTDGNGCEESFSVTLQEPSAINAQVQVIHQTCGLANASIQIINPTGGNGNFQFELNQVIQSGLTVENLNAGSYAISVLDSNACQWDTTITIQSIPFAQSIQLSTVNPSCSDDNGMITIQSIDFAGYNPHISFNNSAPQVLSLPLLINNLADGQFIVSIIDDNQCQLTESISLNRLSAPSGFVLNLTEATCNQPNASVEIIQVQNGNGPYQFALNQGNYSSATTFSNLAPGAHLLSVKDSNACTTDTLIHILEAPSLLASIGQIGHVTCHGFADGTLAVNITQGQGPFTALWNDGVTGLSRSQLSAGDYTVLINDANQCTYELQASIAQPEPLISTLTKVDATCGNSNGEIKFEEISGGTGTYLFALNGQTQTSPNFINLSPGNYMPTVRDANQCELILSDIEILMISYPQSIDFQTTNESCSLSNGALQITTVQGGIYPMQMLFDNQSIAYQGGIENISGLSAGNYQIQLTDANQCTLSQNITIINQAGPDSVETAVSPTTCNLNNGCIEIGEVYGGNGYNLFSLNGVEFVPYPSFCQLASGDYTLSIKDVLGCELVLPIFVPATIPVQADAQKIADITCYGANNGQGLAMAQIGTGPFNYQWSNGEQHAHAQQLPPGSHTAYVTDIYGCIDSSMIQIAEPLPLHVQAYAENPSCAGEDAVLHAEAFGGVGYIQLTWLHNGSHSVSVIVNPLTTTSYLVTATDENACTVQTSITQYVNPLPVADILSDIDKACAPACINFSLALPNQNIASYQWLIADSLSSNNADPKFCFEQPGSIHAQVWLEDVNGCKNTAQVAGITEIYPTPEVNFSFNPSQPNILKPEVAFMQSSTHTSFWRWNLGDGNMAFMPDPVHSYQDTGRFEVCLEVMSAHGCMNDTCLDIYIKPVFTFYMPNAFTPDGDGLNDVFKPEATFVKDIRWMVFNRWGEMIFESKDLNKGWDGFFKGREAQNDVYTWVATLRTFDDQIIRNEGMVKLLR